MKDFGKEIKLTHNFRFRAYKKNGRQTQKFCLLFVIDKKFADMKRSYDSSTQGLDHDGLHGASDLHSSDIRTFPVEKRGCDRPFPCFRKPVEIGCFSQDHSRKFYHDRRQLRHYILPSKPDPCFNLRHGYETLIRKDADKKELIDDLLRWIMLNKHKFVSQPQPHSQAEQMKHSTCIERFMLMRFL